MAADNNNDNDIGSQSVKLALFDIASKARLFVAAQ